MYFNAVPKVDVKISEEVCGMKRSEENYMENCVLTRPSSPSSIIQCVPPHHPNDSEVKHVVQLCRREQDGRTCQVEVPADGLEHLQNKQSITIGQLLQLSDDEGIDQNFLLRCVPQSSEQEATLVYVYDTGWSFKLEIRSHVKSSMLRAYFYKCILVV